MFSDLNELSEGFSNFYNDNIPEDYGSKEIYGKIKYSRQSEPQFIRTFPNGTHPIKCILHLLLFESSDSRKHISTVYKFPAEFCVHGNLKYIRLKDKSIKHNGDNEEINILEKMKIYEYNENEYGDWENYQCFDVNRENGDFIIPFERIVFFDRSNIENDEYDVGKINAVLYFNEVYLEEEVYCKIEFVFQCDSKYDIEAAEEEKLIKNIFGAEYLGVNKN